MANLILAYTNHLAGAQLAAADETTDGAIQNITSIHIVTKWRSLAVPASFTADLGVNRTSRFLALFGVSLSDAATLRLRLSTSDLHNGDVHDSGVVPAAPAETLDGRRQCLLVLPSAKVARYAKVDLDDPGAAFIDVGHAALDDWVQFAYTRSWGAQSGLIDPSLIDKSLGGQTFVTKRPKRRAEAFSLDFIRDAEAPHIRALNARAGSSGPVVMIPDPAAGDAAHEMILGLISAVEPLTRRQVNIRSRPFAIEELV